MEYTENLCCTKKTAARGISRLTAVFLLIASSGLRKSSDLRSSLELSVLSGLLNRNSYGNRCPDHGVIPHTDQTHHLNMGRDRGRTRKLGIRVHAAHGIGHTVRSRACSHIIRMQGTAGAAAGRN